MTSHGTFFFAADAMAKRLEHLMEAFPKLVNSQVEEAVNNWRRQTVALSLSAPGSAGNIDVGGEKGAVSPSETIPDQIASEAIELIASYSIEDVMDILTEDFGITLDYAQLIDLIGIERYQHALHGEAIELQQNKVSLLQTSELWNSMGRPALGDALWGPQRVSILLERQESF